MPVTLLVLVVFLVAVSGTAYWMVGLLRWGDSYGADYLWRGWVLLDEHAQSIGVASMVVFVVAGSALLVAVRAGRLRAPLPAQSIVLTLLAAWLGFGYRVVTAPVTGANIGGGMVLLATPVFVLVAAALVIGMRVGASRRHDRHS